jgi:hypothetical protein
MFEPAPAGLEDVAGHDGPGQANLLADPEPVVHHDLGLVQIPDLDVSPARVAARMGTLGHGSRLCHSPREQPDTFGIARASIA